MPVSTDIDNRIKRLNKCALVVALALSLTAPGLSQSAFAKNLKPVRDVATENEVIKLYNQALKYSKGERNVHARVVLEQAATYDPTSVSPYIHAALSEIYHDLGNPDKAIQEGLQALRYDPSMKDMYYNLGLFCKDANRYNEGIQYLNKFVEMSTGEKRTNALSLIESLTKEQQKMGSFSNNDPDYLGQLMSEGRAHHWAASKIPLKVFIDQNSSARGFKPEFVGIAQNAFVTWYQASGKKLSFAFVNTLDEADINVEWTDGTLKVGDEKYERTKAGLTTTTRHQDVIDKARIQIRTVQAFTKTPEPVDRIKETCLHEIGHALGLNGHSTSTADIMYFGNSARQLPALTKRDKATMARLYSAFAPYPMVGVDTSFAYPAPATAVQSMTGGDGYGGAYGGNGNGMSQPGYSTSNVTPSNNGTYADSSSNQTPSISAGTSSGSPDELLSIPPDALEAVNNPSAPARGTSAEQSNGFGNTQNGPMVPAGTSQFPAWSPPGALSGMPVQSWQTPAVNMPPQGVAWPQHQTYQQTNYGAQGNGGQYYPTQQLPSMPYATTPAQYAAPTGQNWPQSQTPYYQQQGDNQSQSVTQGGYQQGYNPQGMGQQNMMQQPGAGPEQTPGASQQNQMMQYAQQYMPRNGQQR